MTADDSDLRAQFDALKAEDERAVRPFASCREAATLNVMHRDRWIPSIPAIAGVLTLLLVAAIAVFIRPSPHQVINEISRWQSPTASLLKTPGSEFLTNMPQIGEPAIPPLKDEMK